jgi:hypothetical protein
VRDILLNVLLTGAASVNAYAERRRYTPPALPVGIRTKLGRHAARAGTMIVVLALYVLSMPRHLPVQAEAALASSFRFQPLELFPASNGHAFRNVRDVHPALKHIDAWISSVGASVAFADIYGLGRPADICLVDPRNDSVTVMPAPGTGARYAPFALPLPLEDFDVRTIAPMGCLPGDINEDGKVDLVIYYWGRPPLAFLQTGNDRLSADQFEAVELVEERERWFTNAGLLADVDGDGHADLIFGNYFRDGEHILDGSVADTMACIQGLTRVKRNFDSCSGTLWKRATMQHSMSRASNGGTNRLLLWQSAAAHSVAFRETRNAFDPEMANGWTLALGAADLTGDLLPELYVANDFGPDRLLLNKSTPGHPAFAVVEGRRGIATPRSKVLGRDSFKGMGVDFGDIERDGRQAIVVSNISEPYALLESHFLFVNTGDDSAWDRGEAPYRDESSSYGPWTGGWGWDVKFADLDNDGELEILQAGGFLKGSRNRWPELQELAMANDELLTYPFAWPRFRPGDDLAGDNRDRLYVADSPHHYTDVGWVLGLGSGSISRGIAVADVYGDGRLAVAIARQWMPSMFLANISPNAGAALVLNLRVPGAVAGTRAAIGASARLTLPDGRILAAQVDGGSGHSGKRAPEIHFGLGQVRCDARFNVDISWRDAKGKHRVSYALPPGRHTIVLLDSVSPQPAPFSVGGAGRNCQ